MKKILFMMFFILLGLYILVSILLFFFQEKLLFFPEKLDKSYKFQFEQAFEELNFPTEDGIKLNGLHFKTENAKGLIFYLHGNAGSLRNWGAIAKTYTDLDYDFFVFDYRGFGKSEGKLNGENQVFKDVQLLYDAMKKQYAEDEISVIGHSIGTGPATKLAVTNKPKQLILLTPYYSLADLTKHYYSFLPTFVLKYKFETHNYIQKCKMPITIFHGDQDKVIYYESSYKLQKHIKPTDKLIILKGQGHNGVTYNEQYRGEIRKVLI